MDQALGWEAGSGVDAAVWPLRICWACLWASLSSERSYLKNSVSLLIAKEYWWSTAVNSKMSLSRRASLNAAVRIWIKWLFGGRGRLVAVMEIGEAGGPSLLVRAASRLRMWLNGVQQIMQSCCKQGEVLVQVQGGSWRGVSVSVLVLVLVSVSAAGSMLNLSLLI